MDIPSKSYNRAIYHGGDLDSVSAKYGGSISDWMDLSTGINANPYPVPKIPMHLWTSLPGGAQEIALLEAAKEYYELPSSYEITSAPGTQSILQLLPRLVPSNQTVAIQSPTYAEHGNCWRACGHDVRESFSPPNSPADIAVLVNPNNPTCAVISPEKITKWHSEWVKEDGLLIIDEAFMDVTPHLSAAKSEPPKNTLILKSFGKFFGLAGVRLGFATGDPTITRQLSEALGPWALSGIAAEIGICAFQDHKWQEDTRLQLKTMSEQLSDLIANTPGRVVGNAGLFVLAEFENAGTVYEQLCHHHILTRPFEYNDKWLRFGLPKNEEALTRLSDAFSVLA